MGIVLGEDLRYITLKNKSSKSPFANAVFYIRLLKNKLTSYIHYLQQQISFEDSLELISVFIFP